MIYIVFYFRAPSVLKTFHELGIAVRDAYAAASAAASVAGDVDILNGDGKSDGIDISSILQEFLANIKFLLALVDEVAVDKVTRGILKDDVTFKSVKDVIKLGSKLLESIFLVRREDNDQHTLYIRIIGHTQSRSERQNFKKLVTWCSKVEKAVNNVTLTGNRDASVREKNDDTNSEEKNISRGRSRSIMPGLGKGRSRRATPRPSHRSHHSQNQQKQNSSAAENGAIVDHYESSIAYIPQSTTISPKATTSNPLMLLNENENVLKNELIGKAELSTIISQLQNEKFTSDGESADAGDISPFSLSAPAIKKLSDLPSTVPKLPPNYIHRQRIMQQVVNSVLLNDDTETESNQQGLNLNTSHHNVNRSTGPRDVDLESPLPTFITCVTSRHTDKIGNGKSVIAIAAVQTVSVRQHFTDGIIWLDLKNRALVEESYVRRAYADIYRQLVSNDEVTLDDEETEAKFSLSLAQLESSSLDSLRQSLTNYILQRHILLCLDNVLSEEDANWFMFHQRKDSYDGVKNIDGNHAFRILITTRKAKLMHNIVDVQVRILTENEATRLLVTTGGRKPYGIFHQKKNRTEAEGSKYSIHER